jgi:hypothetical protein
MGLQTFFFVFPPILCWSASSGRAAGGFRPLEKGKKEKAPETGPSQ